MYRLTRENTISSYSTSVEVVFKVSRPSLFSYCLLRQLLLQRRRFRHQRRRRPRLLALLPLLLLPLLYSSCHSTTVAGIWWCFPSHALGGLCLQRTSVTLCRPLLLKIRGDIGHVMDPLHDSCLETCLQCLGHPGFCFTEIPSIAEHLFPNPSTSAPTHKASHSSHSMNWLQRAWPDN